MSAWQDISVKPDTDIAALFYYAKAQWTDMDDNPCSFGGVRDHAQRAALGYFKCGRWYEAGTGDDLFIEVNYGLSDFPTHWMPLPEPPVSP